LRGFAIGGTAHQINKPVFPHGMGSTVSSKGRASATRGGLWGSMEPVAAWPIASANIISCNGPHFLLGLRQEVSISRHSKGIISFHLRKMKRSSP
jgi:hypothetical protein